MTDKEKLDAIRAEIHRLVDVRGYDREMANDLFAFMDSLPNEPVSVWHDASELPKKESIIVINNDQTTLSVEYIGQSLSGVEQWAYLDDLLNIDNKFKEEPISEDLEEAARKFIEPYREVSECGTDYNIHPARVFKAGAAWQKERMIDKTCEFLKSYRRETRDGMGYIPGIIDDDTIEDFKKLMGS